MSDGKIKKRLKDIDAGDVFEKVSIAAGVVSAAAITIGIGAAVYWKGFFNGANRQYGEFLEFEKEKVPEAFEAFKKYIIDNNLTETCPFKNWD